MADPRYMVMACGFESAKEIEQWLNRCAAQGYRFVGLTPEGYYIFEGIND